NLYNAFMIAAILRYSEEKKIAITDTQAFLNLRINKLRVKGGNIWSGSYKINLAGQDLNLDDIEHGLLRRQDKRLTALAVKTLDPRIHMAVNCAAMSCPRLRLRAYFAHNLEQMLDENMREFVNAGKQLFFKGEVLQLNKILYWYYHDFDNDQRRAGDYLANYLADRTTSKTLQQVLNKRSKIALRFDRKLSFFYDWKINDRRNFSHRSPVQGKQNQQSSQ
ncbi:MAG: DUF547 domain-containing protein, partial [Pseudomonadota bacterium]|nr:DUF547 domain-containing protein [Pseudomonadota bacterium]